MKKLLPLILLILIGCSEPEPLNYQLLTERDGVHYRKDTNKIYSGPVFNIYGELSEGYIKNGEFDGTVKFFYSNGQTSEEFTFKKNKSNGPFKYFLENGSVYIEGTDFNGNTSGSLKIYHQNQQLEHDITLENGILIGPYKSYYKSGKIRIDGSTNFDLEKMFGVSLSSTSILSIFGRYMESIDRILEDGRDGPYKSYYENGQLKEERTYKDGKQDGSFKTYYDNGQLEIEGTYKDGNQNGPVKLYHENGQLGGEGTLIDGKEDGLFKWYYENGQLKEERTYKDGELIEQKKY